MATQNSNYWKYSLLDLLSAKVFTIFLMQPGFTFNKSDHKLYADISANEVGTNYGYTKGTGITLSGIVVSQDNTNSRGLMTWSNVNFTPSGGNISACGAILVDTTDDIIVAFLDAGGTIIMTDGIPYIISGIRTEID
jgi:hypothetical protein